MYVILFIVSNAEGKFTLALYVLFTEHYLKGSSYLAVWEKLANLLRRGCERH